MCDGYRSCRAGRVRLVVLAVCVAIVAVPAAAVPTHAQRARSERPNVILVITDDQGYGDVGVHGNRMIKTPNLDRLHSQSVRLTDFHVDPTCSPTRSALMSGRYSTRTGVWHTIMGRSLMRTEEVTIAESLRVAGYRTAMFGKWHLGDNYPLRPQDQGFDEAFYNGGGGVWQTPDYWGNDYFDDTYFRNGTPEPVTGYCTDVWFDNALAFIEKNKDRPFFAYITTNAPHGPYRVDAKYSQPYEDAGVAKTMAAFYGMITNIDENVGRLMKRLDALGLTENTILIFMSDNGTAAGAGRRRNEAQGTWNGFNAGMRGAKGSEYDGGHRVPFFVRWPGGGIGGGRDVGQLSAHIDVLPTLMELCGVTRPAGPAIDGISLASLLTGKAERLAPRTLLVHSQRIEHPEKWRKSSVMTERWRLVNRDELYDMRADPGQRTNVADEHGEVVDRLRSRYEAWWSSLSVRFDQYVPIVIGHEAENPSWITAHDWHAPQKHVPWNQPSVRRMPYSNGFWIIEVARPGEYEFTLRHQPAHDPIPLRARTARVRIGNRQVERSVRRGANQVSLRLSLEAKGPVKMQTWLAEADGHERGAFFVSAKRLGPGK